MQPLNWNSIQCMHPSGTHYVALVKKEDARKCTSFFSTKVYTMQIFISCKLNWYLFKNDFSNSRKIIKKINVVQILSCNFFRPMSSIEDSVIKLWQITHRPDLKLRFIPVACTIIRVCRWSSFYNPASNREFLVSPLPSNIKYFAKQRCQASFQKLPTFYLIWYLPLPVRQGYSRHCNVLIQRVQC